MDHRARTTGHKELDGINKIRRILRGGARTRTAKIEGGTRGLAAQEPLAYSTHVTLKVLIHTADEGGFWAEVPALPGCVSQGETVEEVRVNVREAIEGWLLAEDSAIKGKAADQIIEVAV